MMAIHAGNTAKLSTTTARKGQDRFKRQADAKAAATLALGPHARHEFEFETMKVDGAWIWRPTDTVKPDTEAQAKANGGKRPSTLSLAMKLNAAAGASPPLAARTAEEGRGEAINQAAVPLAPAPLEAIPAPAFAGGGPAKPVGDGLDIPACLVRTPETNQARDARVARDKRRIGPDREITMPKTKAKATATKRALNGGKTKTALIGELLQRKSGCTTAEILKTTGWPAVSVPAQARAVGLKLRKEKVKGEPTRYYGTPEGK
jgi:Protein of unknown function (DUF3489)